MMSLSDPIGRWLIFTCIYDLVSLANHKQLRSITATEVALQQETVEVLNDFMIRDSGVGHFFFHEDETKAVKAVLEAADIEFYVSRDEDTAHVLESQGWQKLFEAARECLREMMLPERGIPGWEGVAVDEREA